MSPATHDSSRRRRPHDSDPSGVPESSEGRHLQVGGASVRRVERSDHRTRACPHGPLARRAGCCARPGGRGAITSAPRRRDPAAAGVEGEPAGVTDTGARHGHATTLPAKSGRRPPYPCTGSSTARLGSKPRQRAGDAMASSPSLNAGSQAFLCSQDRRCDGLFGLAQKKSQSIALPRLLLCCESCPLSVEGLQPIW